MSIYDVTPMSVEDYRKRAKRRLPRFLFDYIEGAANSEDSAADNESDFRRFRLKQRVLRNVEGVSTQSTLLGRDVKMPMAIAPVGMAGMFGRRGEVQGARAAARAGIPFTTSTVGICPIEEVAAATQDPAWFQLYMLRDRELVEEMLSRAETAGCDTLVFTIDLAVAGMRLRDYRNGMLGGGLAGKLSQLAQFVTSPVWAVDVGLKGKPHTFGNLSHAVANPNDLTDYKAFVDSQFDPTVTWEDIEWLRGRWKGKLVLKGLLEADDARAAVEVGADGLIVSNHGGRQLDGVASPIMKLPEVAAEVGGEIEILLDGGVRSGIDVAKALALGAQGVLIGRPWVYAMASRGETGLTNLLDLFQQELAIAMALMGIKDMKDFSSDVIERASIDASIDASFAAY
ncbi:MAG: L-lactate dehydrogenase [Myxococcota bacterium]